MNGDNWQMRPGTHLHPGVRGAGARPLPQLEPGQLGRLAGLARALHCGGFGGLPVNKNVSKVTVKADSCLG